MPDLVAIGGGGLAVAHDRSITLSRLVDGEPRPVRELTADVDVTRLHVTAGGDAAIYGNRDRAWLWTAASGPRLLAEVVQSRDKFGVGFVGDTVLVSQHGRLTASSLSGSPLFHAELSTPRFFFIERFIPLPGDHLALFGNTFGDPFDTFVILPYSTLSSDPLSVQSALAPRSPLRDRAPHLAIGPGPGLTAACFRDPEEEELPDPDDDPADLPPLWGFRGLYLLDLTTGAITRRTPHPGPITDLAATDDAFIWQGVTTGTGSWVVTTRDQNGKWRHRANQFS